jgi:hypothetical protein
MSLTPIFKKNIEKELDKPCLSLSYQINSGQKMNRSQISSTREFLAVIFSLVLVVLISGILYHFLRIII